MCAGFAQSPFPLDLRRIGGKGDWSRVTLPINFSGAKGM